MKIIIDRLAKIHEKNKLYFRTYSISTSSAVFSSSECVSI